jgi:lipopolysaccharide cholinephosphotransferase
MEKQLTPAEVKATMVDILSDIHHWCETNGTRYYLAFGTLLGAVRHQGFIPWDDDIDIWMPRPDYDRFLKEYRHDHFKAVWAGNTPDYPLDFAKVHDTRTVVVEEGGDGNWGIFVDVFPLDGVPDETVWKKTLKQVSLVRHLVANQRFTRKFPFSKKAGWKKNLSILAGRIAHPFLSLNALLLREDRIMKEHSYADCGHVCDYTDLKAQFFDKAIFSETAPLPFEGRSFLAPGQYDRCLTMLFGDYMTPPPPEKQVSYHGLEAFWK